MLNANNWLNKEFPNINKRKNIYEIHINEQLKGELDLVDFTCYLGLTVFLYPHLDNNQFQIVNQSRWAKVIKVIISDEWLEQNYPKNGTCIRKNENIEIINGLEKVIVNNYEKDRKTITKLHLNSQNITGILDLSDFVNLEDLYCIDNQFSKISLSKNIMLTKLCCSNMYFFDNKFNTLDLSDLHNLKVLEANFNNLINLTLSSFNQLNEISVSNNKLSDLTIFSNLVNLVKLSINDNLFLGSLQHLVKLTNLKKLNIKNNNFTCGLEYLPLSLEEFGCSGRIAKELSIYGNNILLWKSAHHQLMKNSDQDLIIVDYSQTEIIKLTEIPEFLQDYLNEKKHLFKKFF